MWCVGSIRTWKAVRIDCVRSESIWGMRVSACGRNTRDDTMSELLVNRFIPHSTWPLPLCYHFEKREHAGKGYYPGCQRSDVTEIM